MKNTINKSNYKLIEYGKLNFSIVVLFGNP